MPVLIELCRIEISSVKNDAMGRMSVLIELCRIEIHVRDKHLK